MWLDRLRPSRDHKQTPETPPLREPRLTRFHLDLAVSFVADGRTHGGQSLNVSESGLLARFDQLPEIWSEGQLLLEVGERYLSINARVARVHGNDVGLAFSVATENDQETIRILVESVSDRPLT